MKLSTLTEQYLQHLAVYKGYSPRTCEGYSTTYNQMIAYLLQKGLTDDLRHFTPDEIDGFCHYLAEHGVKPNSISVKMAGVSSFGAWLTRTKNPRGQRYLEVNPALAVERPQRQRVTRPYLHRDELRALLGHDVRATVAELLARDLIMETGLRVSEVARIDVDHVHRSEVTLPDGKVEERVSVSTTVKGRGRRDEWIEIPVSPELGGRIAEYLLSRGNPASGQPLLLNRENRRYTRSTLSEMIARMGKRAGIGRVAVRPHTMRHTMNVIARAEAGLDVATRARLLNHTDMSTLQRYDHMMPGEDVAARDAVRAGIKSYINIGGLRGE